jgi:Ca2+-transporting ATPase
MRRDVNRTVVGRHVTETPALPTPATEPWTVEATEVVDALGSDRVAGLSSDEARRRLELHGPNELRAKAAKPVWLLFAEQFTNAMILVLIGAAVVTVLIGDVKDTVVILAIVMLNGIVGFVQEYE